MAILLIPSASGVLAEEETEEEINAYDIFPEFVPLPVGTVEEWISSGLSAQEYWSSHALLPENLQLRLYNIEKSKWARQQKKAQLNVFPPSNWDKYYSWREDAKDAVNKLYDSYYDIKFNEYLDSVATTRLSFFTGKMISYIPLAVYCIGYYETKQKMSPYTKARDKAIHKLDSLSHERLMELWGTNAEAYGQSLMQEYLSEYS